MNINNGQYFVMWNKSYWSKFLKSNFIVLEKVMLTLKFVKSNINIKTACLFSEIIYGEYTLH